MRILSALLTLLIPMIISAQTAFTYIDTSNSDIPDNWVRVTYLDAAGNKWIGTENGLGMMDPAGNWTVYTTANSDIPGDQILSILVDNDGILWVGTQLNGLGKFDGTTWTHYDPFNSEIPDFQIQAIAKDVNDTIWIGSQGGFTKWDGADYWYTYTAENSPLKSSSILDIYIDANDIKYLGTLNGGLSTYDHGLINYYRKDNSEISDNTVLQITEDADHNKWMATSFGGLSLFTPALSFLNFTPITSDVSDWTVNDVELDLDGTGLLAMPVTGLDIFLNPEWEHYNNDNSSMSDSLTRLVVDADNIAWIGTQSRGLVKFDKTLLAANDNDPELWIGLFPNPATDQVLMQGVAPGSTVVLSGVSGNILQIKKATGTSVIFDVRQLPGGNYFIKCISDAGTAVRQLSVIH